MTAIKKLKENGAESIYIYATHGIFSKDSLTRLQNSDAQEIVVTNTINIPSVMRNPISIHCMYRINKLVNSSNYQ